MLCFNAKEAIQLAVNTGVLVKLHVFMALGLFLLGLETCSWMLVRIVKASLIGRFVAGNRDALEPLAKQIEPELNEAITVLEDNLGRKTLS